MIIISAKMHVFSSLFRTSHISIRYQVESIAGNILCWVKKPDYTSIRKKLIKSKCIDDNTGFTILNLRSKDIFISKSDNTIVIIFQDFKQIFHVDKIFSLKKLSLTRNLDHKLELLSQLGCLTDLNLSDNNKLTSNNINILGLNKDIFNLCFGCQSFIKLEFLEKLQHKYKISNLIHVVRNRKDRCALERVMGLLFCQEYPKLINIQSLFGDILTKHRCKFYNFDEYICDFNNNKLRYPFIKVWTGR